MRLSLLGCLIAGVLLSPMSAAAQVAAVAVGLSATSPTPNTHPRAQTTPEVPKMSARQEWNDPNDIALVSRTFQRWTDAVIAKDVATVATFHDDGFRAGLGEKLLTKAGHIKVEMAVDNKEMKLLKVEATRRLGDLLIVWTTHFIRADSVPEIPDLGLMGDWGNQKLAKEGFVQGEISIWRFEGDQIKCLAFAASHAPPK